MKKKLSSSYEFLRSKLQQLPPDGLLRSSLRTARRSEVVTGLRLALNLPSYRQYHACKPSTFVVLGMHRSGTSCITRIINLCGASAGERLQGPDTSNKLGHWEHIFAKETNKQILEWSGGSWHRPPSNIETNLKLRMRMCIFLAELHDGCQPTVWKDPRTTLTFPAWKSKIAQPIIVSIFRHPACVAASLKSRNGFSKERGIELWTYYNKKLLKVGDRENNVYYINFDKGGKHIDEKIKSIAASTALRYEEDAVRFYDDTKKNWDKQEKIKEESTYETYMELKKRSRMMD